MCAIAGMICLPWTKTLQKKMLSTMQRRGPDGCGIFEAGDCCLVSFSSFNVLSFVLFLGFQRGSQGVVS